MAQGILPRVTVGPEQLYEILMERLSGPLAHTHPTFVFGAPGIGKTQILRCVVEELGYRMFNLDLTSKAREDFNGLPSLDLENNRAVWLPYAEMEEIWVEPSDPYMKYVVFLDELMLADDGVPQAVQNFLDGRICGRNVPPWVILIGASNRSTDGAGASVMTNPMIRRWNILYLEQRIDEWVRWAIDNDLAEQVIGFILSKPEYLWTPKFTQGQAGEPFVNGKSWENVSDNLKAGVNGRNAQAIYQGYVGVAAANDFTASLTYMNVDLNMALTDPNGFPLPTEVSALYYVVTCLSKKATQATMDAIAILINRIFNHVDVLEHTAKTMATFFLSECVRLNEKAMSEDNAIQPITETLAYRDLITGPIGKLMHGNI